MNETVEVLSPEEIFNLARATQGIAENIVGQSQINQAFLDRLVQLDEQCNFLKSQLVEAQNRSAAISKRLDVLMVSGGLGRQNSLYLGDNLALTRIAGRFKMFVDTGKLAESASLLADGWIDLPVTNLIPNILHAGMTFVDIGAGPGYFALLAASAVGRTGRVEAIESDARSLEIINKNICVNGLGVRVRVPATLNPEGVAALLPESFDVIRVAAGADTLRIFDRIKVNLERNPQAKALLELESSVGLVGVLLFLQESGFAAHRILDDGTTQPLGETNLEAAGATILVTKRTM